MVPHVLALGALLLALLPAPAARALDPPPMEVVHVTANTGFAAGGHVALRAGEHAWHFEVRDDGWLRLGREEWELFRLRYGTLENRDMRAVELRLEDGERDALHRALLGLWSRQGADLARLEALGLARAFAEHRAGGAPPSLAGAGFFAPGRWGDRFGHQLRSELERRGAPGLASELERVESELTGWDAEDGAAPLGDLLALRTALLVLYEARGLADAALVDAESSFGDDARGLSGAEREELLRLAARLEDGVARLLSSVRPDRGRPLLLAVARYHAVRTSLAEGRLLLLDAIADDGIAFDPGRDRRHLALVARLAERAARGWREMRALAFAEPLDEAAYNRLEEAATGVYEMHAARSEGRPLRARPLGRMIPARVGALDPLETADTPLLDPEALRARETRFHAALAERYRYDLVLENCATELAELFAAVTPRAAPGTLAFVPRWLVRGVASSDAGGARSELPSWRRRQVRALARSEGRLGVALRESNTWSSTVYDGSISDDHFLFFADGSPWLRPAFGTANLVYGLGHAAVGVVQAPFDRGRRLRGGLLGAFYSVPELMGMSIRKGRYDLAP